MGKTILTVLTVLCFWGITYGKETVKGKPTKLPVKITGQCHCGYVKYQAKPPVIKSSYCSCRGCRKATGTFKAPFVTIKKAGFKVVAGKPVSFRASSGKKCDAHGSWNFCPKCGTQLYWQPSKGKVIDVFAGTLDDSSIFKIKKKK